MVPRGERSIHVVLSTQPKLLTGLRPQGPGAGPGSCSYLVMDPQRSRRTARTSPIRVHLVERGQPVWCLLAREDSRQGTQRQCGERGGKKRRPPWQGVETGCVRSGQYHPPRKRADCPTVSRHAHQGGIDPEGVAHAGGVCHWCDLPQEGIDCSVVSCSQQGVGRLTGPSHGLGEA